ncbi:ABC-type iron-sulfur cluster assembly transport system permease protein [Spiroplasma kunkelii CR2-3x]|uniref:ABC-type iron-sulfur cluster assembly transport system permease protein n=1 Tax=Spiroplasma kunkelii CR2-3x TaxID=273035 RepID=A0A0K2JF38_SPIKU|nr:SufD family Fe-S cluster assembly protein [Spiroplasma kunkelii]ALA97037.1 ABC-type iron-sulfur cluster assembly transport system permease protein [Spiroplasma kunkelii CR2-3x]
MQVLMNEQKIIGDNFIIDATTPKLTFTNNKAGEVININFATNLINETFLFFLNLTSEVTINYNIPANSQINIINIYKNRECEQIANLFYNLLEKAQVNIYHLNIVNSSITENITFNLRGKRSAIKYYLASMSTHKYHKNAIIYAHHLAPATKSEIKTYSIAKDNSLQTVKCTSHIEKKMGKSETHQELRLLVFDKTSKAISDPILLIDENDIKASHANAVGMLDPEQIFYLQTRGLTITQARKLICMGYFKNVIDAIEDEELQKNIIDEIDTEIGE